MLDSCKKRKFYERKEIRKGKKVFFIRNPSKFGDLFDSMLKKVKNKQIFLERMSFMAVRFNSSFSNEEAAANNKDKSLNLAYTKTDLGILENSIKESELEYCIFYLVTSSGLYFIEYRPKLFFQIRKFLGHKNSEIFK